MGKLHKDIAMFMVKCMEDEGNSEQKIIKVLIIEHHQNTTVN